MFDIMFDIKATVTQIIRRDRPDAAGSFDYRPVPGGGGWLRLNFDILLARSLLLQNNGILLHKIIKNKKRKNLRKKFVRRFVLYLRFTPSDFAASGLPWPREAD